MLVNFRWRICQSQSGTLQRGLEAGFVNRMCNVLLGERVGVTESECWWVTEDISQVGSH